MNKHPHAGQEFQPGDNIRVVMGPYQGTEGVFLHLRDDTNWGLIRESDGKERLHPLEWMEHLRGIDTLKAPPSGEPTGKNPASSATREEIETWEGEGGSAVSRPLIRRASEKKVEREEN